MQPYNLTNKIAEQFADTHHRYQQLFPEDAAVRQRFASAMRSSTHFLLPTNGICLDPSVSCRENVPLMVLPDDVVAFEFRMLPDDDLPHDQMEALDRVAFAWNHDALWEPAAGFNLRESAGQPGFFVASFYQFRSTPNEVDPSLSWQYPAFCMFIPRDQSFLVNRVDHELDGKVATALDREIKPVEEAALYRRCILFNDQYQLAIDNMGDADAVIVDSLRNLHDEYIAVTTALFFLSLQSVDTLVIDAPTKLNVKRKKQGKKELPAYHILAVRSPKGDVSPYTIEQTGPRQGSELIFAAPMCADSPMVV
ncbi:hypothetical protein OAS86_02285 [Gammaproteobacteria bacterium]|nr:hypothetical protein [Gammaproteobacteria bacterium]